MDDLYSKIILELPELEITSNYDAFGKNGIIKLVDDGNGQQFIEYWNYTKPIPKSLEIYKSVSA